MTLSSIAGEGIYALTSKSSVVWLIDIEAPNPSEEQRDDAHNVRLDLLPRSRLPLGGHALSHWTHRSSCSTSCRQYSGSGRGAA